MSIPFSLEQLQEMISSISIGIEIRDARTLESLYCNSALLSLFESHSVADFVLQTQARSFDKQLKDDIQKALKDESHQIHSNWVTREGHTYYLTIKVSPLRLENSKEKLILLEYIDSTPIKEKEHYYEQVLDMVKHPISITDNNLHWTFVNKIVRDSFSKKLEDFQGRPCQHWRANICQTDACTLHMLHSGQEPLSKFHQWGCDFSVTGHHLYDLNGKEVGHVEVVSDVTNQVLLESKVEEIKQNLNLSTDELDTLIGTKDSLESQTSGYTSPEDLTYQNAFRVLVALDREHQQRALNKSYTDGLTGLHNRVALSEELQDKNISDYQFILFNFNNFRRVNDLLGPKFGDSILKLVAKALLNVESEYIKAYRISGDEFILACSFDEGADFWQLIEENSTILMFERSDITLQVRGSYINLKELGLDIDFNQVLMYMNFAMKKAKTTLEETHSIVHIDKEIIKNINQEQIILKQVRSKLLSNYFVAYFQPFIDIHTGKIIGCEALARYQLEGKILPPGLFLPLLVDEGCLADLDLLIFEECVKFVDCLLSKGLIDSSFTVSSNISPSSLCSLSVSDFDNIIRKYPAVSKDNIYLEITEESVVDELSFQLAKNLSDSGFKLAIDDFAAGCTSLKYIAQLNIDMVKMDRGLLVDIANPDSDISQKNKYIYEAIVHLASNLECLLVAEGIEELCQSELLETMGVKIGQGFLYSKPLPKSDFEDFVCSNLNEREKV